MSLDVPLLRSSFALVAEAEPALAARFYDHLFGMYPQVKPLFASTPMDRQQQMLTEALVAVVEHLDDADWLSSHLQLLGRRHVNYGISHEMYGWVGAALLATLAEVAGPAWSDQLASAWGAAYGAIVDLMLAGAAHAA